MDCVGTPARSLSSWRSRISEGGVSSINWTNGSMASEYWTRCGMGMASFSLGAVFGFVGFTLSINAAPLDRRRPCLNTKTGSQHENRATRGLLTFPEDRPARFADCQLRTTHQGYAPE